MSPDLIKVKRLLISTHIGVPDEERAEPQELCVNLEMVPVVGFSELNDEIENGVDYYAVSLAVKELAAARPRKLIETLAEDIADHILSHFAVASLSVEVEKYILSDADHVAVAIQRAR